MTVVGAVNGVAATINASTPGSLTIPFADNGVPSAFTVQPSGSPHTPTSSRVAVIGGSTAGRDHFPFPVPAGDLDDLTGLVMFSLDFMLVWFYRVKKWKINGNFTWNANTADYPEGVGFSGAFGEDAVMVAYNDAEIVTNEPGLITSVGVFDDAGVDFFSITNSENSDVSGFDAFDIAFLFDDTTLGDRITYYTEGFRPRFGFDILTQGSGNIALSAEDTGGLEQVGNFQIDGNEVSKIYLVGSDEDASVSGIDFNVSLDPIEYWPYATKAGLPVYDTTTGAQLRDPLS